MGAELGLDFGSPIQPEAAKQKLASDTPAVPETYNRPTR
jgi:hypothetical protein